jgi:hypothetical protein
MDVEWKNVKSCTPYFRNAYGLCYFAFSVGLQVDLWQIQSQCCRDIVLTGYKRAQARRLVCYNQGVTGPATAGIPDIVTADFCGSPQFLQANAGIVPGIKSQPLPSTYFAIHHLLNNPSRT